MSAAVSTGSWITAAPSSILRRRVGGRVGTVEMNSASLPIYNIGSGVDGSWQVSTLYRGQPLTAIGIGPLTMRDALLLAALDTRYLADDCPADRWVTFTLPQARSWMGYRGRGGKSNRLVLGSIRRIADVAVTSVLWGMAGTRASRTWRFVDVVEEGARPRAGSLVRVQLSEVHVSLLREGRVTLFDIPTFSHLLDRSPLAAHLWLILEADSGPEKGQGWSYRLWHTERRSERPHDMPALAARLGMSDPNPSRVVAKVRAAAALIESVDPRYVVSLNSTRGRVHAVLRVRRRRMPLGTGGYGTGDPVVRGLGTGGYAIEHDNGTHRRSLPSFTTIVGAASKKNRVIPAQEPVDPQVVRKRQEMAVRIARDGNLPAELRHLYLGDADVRSHEVRSGEPRD